MTSSSEDAAPIGTFHMLLIDQEAALVAIPLMMPLDADVRRNALDLIKQALSLRS
jgi:hypothetical protein